MNQLQQRISGALKTYGTDRTMVPASEVVDLLLDLQQIANRMAAQQEIMDIADETGMDL